MLATCSNILQLWNSETYSLVNEFGHDHLPSTDIIKCVDWKKDNSNYLVFAYKQTGRVQLYDIQKNKSVELAASRVQHCSFSQSGKYLTVTNEDCQAHIWDVNSGRICQTFNSIDQSPIECLCWGNGDSYIASGTRNGNIFLYNQLTKQTFAPFTTKNTNKISSISSIKWSPHKDLLATTSNDGFVSLWNPRLKELFVCLHSHKAPSTDLVFSPQNDAFLVSSGMDGSLCCFDVIKQKNLSTINIYSPLTSVDFHPNGSLVCVGTMGQNSSIYDLRDPKIRLSHLINSQHGNVYSVRFDGISSTNSNSTIINRLDSSNLTSNKGLSTFAQQTNRSRQSSTTTIIDVPSNSNRPTNTNNSTINSTRERSLSSQSNPLNLQLNNNLPSNNSTLNSNRLNSLRKEPTISQSNDFDKNENESTTITNQIRPTNFRDDRQRSMSFDQFTRLCGFSNSTKNSSSAKENNENESDLDHRLQYLVDQRFDSLREDLQFELNQMKISLQMYIVIELNKLKTDLIEQIEANSINSQLLDEIRILREENQILKQCKQNF